MSITDRARAEAKCRADKIESLDYESTPDAYTDGFEEGTEWAASQEPTDAEVEAAAEQAFTLAAISRGDPERWQELTEHPRDWWRALAREILTAAREARG